MSLTVFSLARPGSIIDRTSKLSLILFIIGLLQACASGTPTTSLSYDLGAVAREHHAAPSKIAISLADVSAPSTLDSNAMLYRLQYNNAQLLHPYAQHHWSMPPAQLFAQRFKARIAAAGGTVLGAADGVAELPVLRIEMDEFSQVFTSPTQSEAKIALRVSLIKKNKLIGQHYFDLATASASADASGGAKAMQVTTDRSISAILAWLQTLSIN